MAETATYTLAIDGPLLRSQRQCLLDLTEKTSSEDSEHLEGIIALLDEVADQAHDHYGIDCLLLSKDGLTRCECEEPGYFCSGVPGILAHMEAGCVAEGAQVERCGLCCRYPSDEAALQKLRELGLASP